jgi:hypothetical protein
MKKRALLIFTGTVGALGGVFAITPPQFGNNSGGISGGTTPTSAPTAAPTKSAVPTKSAKPAPSKAGSTATPAPAPSQTAVTPPSGDINVTGDTFAANEGGRNWGNVKVKVTFTNGEISSITGSQSPTSRGQWAFDRLDPYVSGKQITVAGIKAKAASALPFVSGVSYSSMAYWNSLKSAISKAGL